jgi:hypothetical protein
MAAFTFKLELADGTPARRRLKPQYRTGGPATRSRSATAGRYEWSPLKSTRQTKRQSWSSRT